ncbi:MAG: 3-isopropylmalate dehydratase large subunit [Alphaproteobacteria bacterium]|nr:3-isopropylmalate dehydratase large subunit [Alphaproteobacteria bacterium]MBU0876511.1 3-isopropylmalate dehydratase large subunit [Alphaproteobacteria bacterium]MBU1770982.1 3-isopropylmalate dehydratase large subunit [Alphaproteobacteria bacterium]
MNAPRNMLDKIWDDHIVRDFGDNTCLVHVDRAFLHELAAIAFSSLKEAGRPILSPELTFATVDHLLDTYRGRGDATLIPNGADFIRQLRAGARETGVGFFDIDDPEQGIVHVMAPEQGIALPGTIFVCCDSHTSTIGGVGAMAWGIGTTDIEHAMATGCLVQTKPLSMRVRFEGRRPSGVTAKDMILALIGQISADGGNGYAIEYAGEAVEALSIEERLTICNMSIELSARAGFVAPDERTFAFLKEKPYAPKGAQWDAAVDYWRTLSSDTDARFDREVVIDCARLSPQVTWGTSPEHVIGVEDAIPDPSLAPTSREQESRRRAINYMGVSPGQKIAGLSLDAVFIGSCTNSRLNDLREAASILRGRKVAPGLMAICSPGSGETKRRAEAEGIDRIFTEAGFQWREPGCSLCMSGGAGGEAFPEHARVLSSTNRNFENRQGRNVRSHLGSPAMVAASAVAGRITDPRSLA